MFNVTTKSIEWGEERLTLETGKVARQADGTVIATLGETSVMANVTFAKAARLIDRPIRPLFVDGFKNEVLVMCTVLSHDLVNDPDIVAMIAASAALTISGAPFMGPIAGCRVGYTDGEYVLNPTVDDMDHLRDRRRDAQRGDICPCANPTRDRFDH